MLVQNAEIDGEITQVRCSGKEIVEIAPSLSPSANEKCLDAQGGALLRGLHDHHLHLFSLAADLASAPCGPPHVETEGDLKKQLANAVPQNGWVRGTGYFESVAGRLDRNRLDALGPSRPLRIQHRSGAMWFLNSLAIETLDLESDSAHTEYPTGLERDERGRPTGRIFRADGWLRERLSDVAPPDLSAVGSLLSRYGVTGVTDATPTNGSPELDLFREAQNRGALPQKLRMMGHDSLDAASPTNTGPRLSIDAFKILLDEPALPSLDELVNSIRRAHSNNRGVAVHTVTRSEIFFALTALEAARSHPGDRLEHASVAPPEAMDKVVALGVRIVTQPNFIAERGDAYREHVAAIDQPHLYKVQSWIDRHVPLALGTDAPFGDPDPWHAMRAAVRRETSSGVQLGPAECISPETALALFDPERILVAGPGLVQPGDGPRPLRPGDPADLCLLGLPWSQARSRLRREDVRATVCAGQIVYSREP